jgi:glycosyltransferase involved in cell wall biosynthesis
MELRLRILHVIRSIDPRGGGPIEFANSISDEWIALGHHCDILTLDSPTDPVVTNSRLTTFAVGTTASSNVSGHGYGFTSQLVPWIKKHRSLYDFVLVHGLWNYASVGSWRGLRRTGVPYFVFPHGMLDPWFNSNFPFKAVAKRIFWMSFENRVLRDSCGVLFTTTEERDLAGQSFRPYHARSFVVGLGTRDIHGDAVVQRLAFTQRMPQLNGRRFVLFLSRIHPKKGIDLLLHAFARQSKLHPDLDLVVAGPDQVGLQSKLMSLAGDLGIATRVHWPGMLTGDAKLGAFRASEFFALTSHQENFGIAIAEALAMSKPVLITNKINIWRDIEEDQAGIIVNDNIDDVSNGFSQLCIMSSEQRLGLGSNARRCFDQRYDLKRIAVSMIGIMDQAGQSWNTDVNWVAPRTLAN